VDENSDLQQPRHGFSKRTLAGGEEEASENPDYLSYPRLYFLNYLPNLPGFHFYPQSSSFLEFSPPRGKGKCLPIPQKQNLFILEGMDR
jgi:hypothetical protein